MSVARCNHECVVLVLVASLLAALTRSNSVNAGWRCKRFTRRPTSEYPVSTSCPAATSGFGAISGLLTDNQPIAINVDQSIKFILKTLQQPQHIVAYLKYFKIIVKRGGAGVHSDTHFNKLGLANAFPQFLLWLICFSLIILSHFQRRPNCRCRAP